MCLPIKSDQPDSSVSADPLDARHRRADAARLPGRPRAGRRDRRPRLRRAARRRRRRLRARAVRRGPRRGGRAAAPLRAPHADRGSQRSRRAVSARLVGSSKRSAGRSTISTPRVGEPAEEPVDVRAGVIRQRVEGVEDDVDAGALVAGDGVAGRPDHLVADRLDAVVQERAAGCLAPREVLDRLARAGVGAEREHDARRRGARAAAARARTAAGTRRGARPGCRSAVLMSHAIGASGWAGMCRTSVMPTA